jgi:hypothetical protein
VNLRANVWRVSGIAGLLFVVVPLPASFGNVQAPSYDAGHVEIAAWFAEESDQYRVGHFIAGLGTLLFYFSFFSSQISTRGFGRPRARWRSGRRRCSRALSIRRLGAGRSAPRMGVELRD